MIHHLRGVIEQRDLNVLVLDVGGLGYEISIPFSTSVKLPSVGSEVKLYIVEAVAMYGGPTTLYGFLSGEERDIFQLLRDEVPGAGAKKALDYLDKVSKSLPDFRRCIIDRDTNALIGVFGFTKKTAEKIAEALKDKISELSLSGKEKWALAAAGGSSSEAVDGLVALGYREIQARQAVDKAVAGQDVKTMPVEEVIRRSLKYL